MTFTPARLAVAFASTVLALTVGAVAVAAPSSMPEPEAAQPPSTETLGPTLDRAIFEHHQAVAQWVAGVHRAEEQRKAEEAKAAAEAKARAERLAAQRAAAAAAAPAPPPPAIAPASSSGGCPAGGDPNVMACWDKLAGCESGGNWAINTGNGYYGGIQFSLSSWQAVGGTGYPHEHSRSEQIRRGIMLWNQGGWGHWPACTRGFGWR